MDRVPSGRQPREGPREETAWRRAASGAEQGADVIMRGEVRVGMVVYGDIALDSRVQREASSLVQAGHSVALFCLSGSRATTPMLDA